MKKINLAISGCMGRMGQQLIKSAGKDKSIKLVTLTENRVVNKKVNGIKPEYNTEKAFNRAHRIKSFYYHHDLRPMSSFYDHWGYEKYKIYTNNLGFKDSSNREVKFKKFA